MDQPKPLLILENIKKIYKPSDAAAAVPVLNDISLAINAGESISIVGPSGSGKSTLLNLMGALDRPTAGTVTLEETDLSRVSDSELSFIRNKKIGFIFQLHHLLPQCTVLENVLVPGLAFKGTDMELLQSRAMDLLKRVGLETRLHHRPGELSVGERQRTAVVRALINKPVILLADEPTGSLDGKNALRLVELLVEFNKEENLALVMVTHSLELARYMKKIFNLKDGALRIEK